MFYDDKLQIEILDIYHCNRTKHGFFTPKRPFHILTKRISGYTDMMFESGKFTITSDNLMYIPANTEYSRQSYDDEEIIAVHFNILNKTFKDPIMINVDKERCDEAFSKIHRIWTEREPGFRYRCHAVLYEYLSSIIMNKQRAKEYYKIEKSIKFIESNLTQNIQVSSLAKMCNLCESQYRKLFKKEFGISPVKYINKLRVNSAISKLNSGYYSIAEISDLCGFSDQKYFHSVFKSETGKSPSQYQKDLFYYTGNA